MLPVFCGNCGNTHLLSVSALGLEIGSNDGGNDGK